MVRLKKSTEKPKLAKYNLTEANARLYLFGQHGALQVILGLLRSLLCFSGVCLFVCLFVCPLNYSISFERISMKFFWRVGHGPQTK